MNEPGTDGRARARRRAAGVTLLELLMVVSIVGILLAVGVPAFSELAADNRRAGAVNALVTAVHHTRSEAVKRAAPVVWCPSVDGRQCSGSSDGWHQGWLIFENLDGDRPARVDAGEPVIRRGNPRPGSTITANRAAFVFRPLNKRATNGTLVVCDHRGAAAARAVIISPVGRPRTSDRDPRRKPLRCPPAGPL